MIRWAVTNKREGDDYYPLGVFDSEAEAKAFVERIAPHIDPQAHWADDPYYHGGHMTCRWLENYDYDPDGGGSADWWIEVHTFEERT